MKGTVILLASLITLSLSGQVPLEEIVEDKSDMADDYYGTFKFKDEVFSGKAIAYHTDGSIKTLRHFKDGKYNGMWTEWYANGNRKFQGDRKENKGHGLTRWWYENGQIKKQGTYNMDKQEGVVVWWHPNGNLKQIRHYKNGEAFGGWTIFNEDGTVFDEGDDNHKYYRSFFGEEDPLDGFERASPSFTTDGQIMVYVRYTDWMQKIPYIAYLKNDKWVSKRLDFVNYVYNLAISPDGNRIIYKKHWPEDQDDVSKTYVVDKKNGLWENPIEVKSFEGYNAGYFNFTPDGTLYFFTFKPKTGIYFAEPDPRLIYSKPRWLSDDISPGRPTSFDVFMHPDKNKLIITQDSFPKEMLEEVGGNGIYYYEKKQGIWTRTKKLPLAYGWGSSVLPDGKFVYVRNSDIYYVNLNELGIDW